MFRRIANVVVKFLRAEDGPTAVEYAVMLALILVVCLVAVASTGSNSKTTYTRVGNTLGGTGS